jgi:hypothetical protein
MRDREMPGGPECGRTLASRADGRKPLPRMVGSFTAAMLADELTDRTGYNVAHAGLWFARPDDDLESDHERTRQDCNRNRRFKAMRRPDPLRAFSHDISR